MKICVSGCVSKLTEVSTHVMYLPTMLSSNLNYLYGLHVSNEYIISDITQFSV